MDYRCLCGKSERIVPRVLGGSGAGPTALPEPRCPYCHLLPSFPPFGWKDLELVYAPGGGWFGIGGSAELEMSVRWPLVANSTGVAQSLVTPFARVVKPIPPALALRFPFLKDCCNRAAIMCPRGLVAGLVGTESPGGSCGPVVPFRVYIAICHPQNSTPL